MLVGPFKYVAPQVSIHLLCTTNLQRAMFIYISYSEASLSVVNSEARTLIISPFDQFMAADVVLVVTFHFLTPVFFGQVA